MSIEKNVYDVLKRDYDNKDMEWNSNIAYRIRKSLEENSKLIKSWYEKDNFPNTMDDMIEEYFNSAFDTQTVIGVNFGYTYFNDQVKKFLINPNSMWEVYDKLKHKVNLYDEPFIRYTPNEKQNTEMFLREAFSILVTEMNFPRMLIDTLDEDSRRKTAEGLAKYYNKKGKTLFEEDCRSRLILKIKEAVGRLDELGALEKNREMHNNKMKRLGVESLAIKEDIPALEGDQLFGRDLNKCSILELEGMLSFYYNQLEKVRENIGFSLFVMQELEDENGFNENTLKLVSEDKLKNIWKKYHILSKISDEVLNTVHKMEIEAEWKIEEDKLENAYQTLFGKYMGAYSKLIYGIEFEEQIGALPKTILEDEHIETEFEKDIRIFTLVSASFKMNNYLIKSRLMEDIIIQADREKLNWGIMEEEGEIKIKNVALIGVDIPGLNMPLRLHYMVDNIQDLMANYLNTSEVPLYVGSDDFDTRGKTEGTQLLLPLTKTECNFIKSIYKKAATLPTYATNFVKHLACMQMPNMLKRLLKEKTDGEQIAPDFINIFTKKITKSQISKKYSPDNMGENR